MFLHIGKGKTVREEKILGVFDMDTATVSRETRAFISRATKEKRVEYEAAEDMPRSFLILVGEGDGRERLVLSHISPASLVARAERSLSERYDEE